MFAQKTVQPSKSKSAVTKHPAPLGIPASYRDLLDKSTQALMVTTAGWNAVDGRLQRYEKREGRWLEVGDWVPVVVGKNGLGWDALVEPAPARAPAKKEGDGRSPAGIFTIGHAFGFAPAATDLKLPYQPLTDKIECVDDPSSQEYNQVVDRDEIANPDWNSSEKMRTIDAYKEGAIVNYNAEKIPDAGSCIFLHIWSGSGHGTAGCTAMPEDKLREVLGWLDESKNPVLIQLPAATYKEVKETWKLP